jgi:hypothetical protein
MPLPLFLFSGYFTGISFGVHVLLLLSQRLKDASSKYTNGSPEAITFANFTPKFSTAAGDFSIAY